MSEVLFNVTAQFSHLLEPDTSYGQDKYKIVLGPLTDEQVDQLETLGLGHRIQNNKDYSPNISFSTQTINRTTGNRNPAPEYVDKNNEPIEGVLMGRNSVVDVIFSVYKSKKWGTHEAILEGVRVQEMVDPVANKTVTFASGKV